MSAALRGARTRVGALLVPPAGDAIVKMPATLAYGLEELPPAVVTWISAVQHVGVLRRSGNRHDAKYRAEYLGSTARS